MWGEFEDSKELTGYIELHYPTAQDIFTNCPGNNSVGNGISCEARFITGGQVRQVVALVEPVDLGNGNYAPEVIDFNLAAPASQRLKQCRPGGLTASKSEKSVRLRAHGVVCKEARIAAKAIAASTTTTLRLRSHFTFTGNLPHDRGFVINHFHCRGQIRERQHPRSAGRVCRTDRALP